MQHTFLTLLVAAVLSFLSLAVHASPAPVPAPANAVPCVQCSPMPKPVPDAATCDITTSCITIKPNGQYHCACRAGYKSAYGNTESYNSYRVPFAGEGYRVFVRPGVPCNTLCDRWQLGPYSCQEVAERPECI